MKLTHEQKVKMARKMRTQKEIQDRVSIFQSGAWENRKESIRRKVEKIEQKAKKKL